ncbi:hypothetical protein K488DRAFT_88385 [Vararia minispora EC-137]|uniref:Uncharacterized protein n=1 Tax=Vararia minispora EC-137 TaxID=1314806 RepID=A0ACB8QDN1_9AGAM|nr:hypothetical protein K488DRAFT_88385 [Vararia minispora EC-137]
MSGVSFENNVSVATKGSGDWHNNDGTFIADLTDPGNSACCFVPLGITGIDELPPNRYWMLPSPEEYVRVYHPEGEQQDYTEKDVIKTVEKLADVPLVSIEALAEARPWEYDTPVKPGRNTGKAGDKVHPRDVSSPIPFLSSLCIDAAFSNYQVEGLVDLMWMPDKVSLVAECLRTQASITISDTSLPMLMHVLKHELSTGASRLDISLFALSPTQLAVCMREIVKPIDSIKLGKHAGLEHVHALLTAHPHVRRLDLSYTAIPSTNLAVLLDSKTKLFCQVKSIAHPLFLENGHPVA